MTIFSVNFQVSWNSEGWKDEILIIGLHLEMEDKVMQPVHTSPPPQAAVMELAPVKCEPQHACSFNALSNNIKQGREKKKVSISSFMQFD